MLRNQNPFSTCSLVFLNFIQCFITRLNNSGFSFPLCLIDKSKLALSTLMLWKTVLHCPFSCSTSTDAASAECIEVMVRALQCSYGVARSNACLRYGAEASFSTPPPSALHSQQSPPHSFRPRTRKCTTGPALCIWRYAHAKIPPAFPPSSCCASWPWSFESSFLWSVLSAWSQFSLDRVVQPCLHWFSTSPFAIFR